EHAIGRSDSADDGRWRELGAESVAERLDGVREARRFDRAGGRPKGGAQAGHTARAGYPCTGRSTRAAYLGTEHSARARGRCAGRSARAGDGCARARLEGREGLGLRATARSGSRRPPSGAAPATFHTVSDSPRKSAASTTTRTTESRSRPLTALAWPIFSAAKYASQDPAPAN